MKITILPKDTEEVITGSDFIVVRDFQLIQDMRDMKNPPAALKGKLIIYAPDGIEFVSAPDLEKALAAAKQKKGGS